jgi:hypothetical protein
VHNSRELGGEFMHSKDTSAMATFKGPSRKYFARFASVKKDYLEVEPFLVTTEFTVGDKKTDVSSAQIKRLNELASGIIDDFEDAMHDVILKKDQEIAALIGKAKVDGSAAKIEAAKDAGAKIANDTLTSIKSTADKLEVLLQEKIKAAWKTDKLLKEINTEFKIKVAYNITKSTISLGRNVAQLVGSAGADVTAWIGLAKAIKAIGEQVYDAAKSEDKLKQDLFGAIAARQKDLNKLWEQMGESLLEKFNRWRTNTAKELETSRKRYDVYLGGCIKQVDGMSTKLDAARKKLNVELKKLPPGEGLKKGIPAGKALMDMQTALNGYVKGLESRRKFANDMAMLVTAMGGEVDRTSYMEKVRKLMIDPIEIVKSAKDVYDTANSAVELIKEITELF